MLAGHKPPDIVEVKNRLGSKKPDLMIETLEQVNGFAANPDIFKDMLTPLIDAVSTELADNSFCQSAAQTLKEFPEKSALALIEVAFENDPDRALGALLQLDLLVIDTVSNTEGKVMDLAVQSELVKRLGELHDRYENNINLVAETILYNLRPR